MTQILFSIYFAFIDVLHVFQGYDAVSLLEYLVGNSIRPTRVIYNGSKIMFMEIAKVLHVRILDSLNCLPMKLASLPASFGLRELCKGYYLISFYPEPKAYGADYMSTKDKTAFQKWHDEKTVNNAGFDFRKEMESYCMSDVDILKRFCLQFRDTMLETTDVDPFQFVTITSVCMGIYKSRYSLSFLLHQL